jgi:hypothetical protein
MKGTDSRTGRIAVKRASASAIQKKRAIASVGRDLVTIEFSSLSFGDDSLDGLFDCEERREVSAPVVEVNEDRMFRTWRRWLLPTKESVEDAHGLASAQSSRFQLHGMSEAMLTSVANRARLLLASASIESSQREYSNRGKWSSQTPYVIRIAGRDNGGVELRGSSDDESVDSVRGGELQTSQEVSRSLSDDTGQIEHLHAGVVQKMVEGRVVPHSSRDFCQDRRWHSNQSSPLMREAQDCRSAFC